MNPSFPQIFQTEDLKYEDRFSVYWNEILKYCKPGEVRERVAKYVAQHVSASEWTAVWRSTPASNGTQSNCDIVVEVDNHLSELYRTFSVVVLLYRYGVEIKIVGKYLT